MFLRCMFTKIPTHSLVLLNAKIHRTEQIANLFNRFCVKQIFNAPYSSDYNPIELAFGWIKNRLKGEEFADHNLRMAVETLIGRLSETILLGNVMHCWKKWLTDEPLFN